MVLSADRQPILKRRTATMRRVPKGSYTTMSQRSLSCMGLYWLHCRRSRVPLEQRNGIRAFRRTALCPLCYKRRMWLRTRLCRGSQRPTAGGATARAAFVVKDADGNLVKDNLFALANAMMKLQIDAGAMEPWEHPLCTEKHPKLKETWELCKQLIKEIQEEIKKTISGFSIIP